MKEPTSITDSIYENETYLFGCEQLKTTGTYKDTVTSASGKDSIITLTLIWAAEKDTLRDTVYATICFGDSYPFGSKSLNTQGFYRDALKTTAGKDSISNLDMTVLKALADTVVTDSFIFADDTYTWREKSYNTSGRYKDNFQVYGCDSVYYRLQLDVRSIIRVEEPAVNKVVCINETIISRLQSWKD